MVMSVGALADPSGPWRAFHPSRATHAGHRPGAHAAHHAHAFLVLFGAGMALSGYCPGTAAAAAGSGPREGVWAMAGMLAAATVFVATYPRLKKALEAG